VTRLSEALSACLLVLLFYSVYVGFRWFVKQRGIESRRELLLAGGAFALVLAASFISGELAVAIGRCIGLAIGANAVSMLWRCRVKGLKATSRACSVVLAMAMLIIVVNMFARLPMEAWLINFPESGFVVIMRAITIMLVTLLSFSFVAIFVGETNRRLQEDTRTDSLTKLRNRRAMEEVAIREVWQAVRRQTPLALLMLDLDHFKDLNDTWGHALGDRALRVVGSVLQREMGPRELTARMGGEEFAVLLPETTLEDAGIVAERLRFEIAALRLHETENSASMTVSIGVSVLRDGEHGWTEMLCRADDALYRAKRAGRNQVALCAIGASPMSGEPVKEKPTWRSRYSVPKQLL